MNTINVIATMQITINMDDSENKWIVDFEFIKGRVLIEYTSPSRFDDKELREVKRIVDLAKDELKSTKHQSIQKLISEIEEMSKPAL